MQKSKINKVPDICITYVRKRSHKDSVLHMYCCSSVKFYFSVKLFMYKTLQTKFKIALLQVRD